MIKIFICRIEYSDAELQQSPEDHEPDYDAKFDNVDTLLGDLCEILQGQEQFEFLVSCFGQDWPVDVSTDLLTILMQLNGCIKKIDKGDFDFCLDFYEQGIERRLYFKNYDNDSVKISCESDTDWIPTPSEIFVDKNSISLSFNKLKFDFVYVIKKVCPKLSSHEWFANW